MRDACLQEREHIVFVLSLLQLFVGGNVPDAQDAALLIVEEQTLEADLHFQ